MITVELLIWLKSNEPFRFHACGDRVSCSPGLSHSQWIAEDGLELLLLLLAPEGQDYKAAPVHIYILRVELRASWMPGKPSTNWTVPPVGSSFDAGVTLAHLFISTLLLLFTELLQVEGIRFPSLRSKFNTIRSSRTFHIIIQGPCWGNCYFQWHSEDSKATSPHWSLIEWPTFLGSQLCIALYPCSKASL